MPCLPIFCASLPIHMLDIRDISLQRGDKILFNQASLKLYPRERMGLIGKNGSGKTSLFALIEQHLLPDSGSLMLPEDWHVATVRQETPALDCSALDYVLQADGRLQHFQAALMQAERDNDGEAIAIAHQHLADIDAYSAPARASKLLNGLGFSTEEHTLPVKQFSGGWRMRLNLAAALMSPADLLLLDEPTNHLDLETVLWLESHLLTLPCAQLIVSHDGDFLNAVTEKTCELHHQKLTVYGGNYDFYQKERAIRLQHQAAAYAKQQAHINHLQSFINRFKAKATKAAQAQSRIKALARMEKIAPAHLDSDFSFSFLTPENLPNPLIQINQGRIGYANNPLLSEVSFSLESHARYGLLGVNGSGKSTFIKTLIGDIPLLSGSLVRSDKLKIGYFAQHQLDVLRLDKSPIWHIAQLSPEVREQNIRDFLGSFAFVGEMATQAIAPFSGGEKARLALAILVWQKPNCLLLDEPTNHLDLSMRHALSLALQTFQGALIVISHDRSLLESVCDDFLLIHSGCLKHFEGDLNDYRALRLRLNVDNTPSASERKSRKTEKREEAVMRQEIARLCKSHRQTLAQCEEKMEKYQKQKQAAEAFLASEDAYLDENKTLLSDTLQQLRTCTQALATEEEAWLTAQEAIETIYQQFDIKDMS